MGTGWHGILAGATIALGAIGCGGDRTADEAAAPRESMETLLQGQPLEHAFVIPNDGDSAIVIREVTATAGAVTHVDSVIPPDSAGRVRVRLETGRFLGVLSVAIRVGFAGSRPPAVYRIQRRVVAPVEFAPQDRVYFFTAKGEPAQGELTIINHLERPLDVASVTSTNPLFRADVKPLEVGQRYRLTVVLDTTAPVGRHQATIRLMTNVPEHSPLTVEGRAHVKDVVHTSVEELDYSRLDFDALDRAAVAQRTVLVQKYRGTDFRVVRAVTDVPFLRVTVEPRKPGESYFVHVRIQQERAPRGRFQGALRIETNDSTGRELRLPIRGEIL